MTTAREYLRVSVDRSGRERSQDEQHTDNVRAATANGFTLAGSYRDTGSASRYASKAREGYDQLIADLEADRFGAELLVLWIASRGSRRASEWHRLMELCEDRGVKIYITDHDRTYDPRKWRDRKSLRDDASTAESTSDEISEQVKRGLDANLAKGWFQGRCPWGYLRDYDQKGQPQRQYPDPERAPLVKELFERVLGGESFTGIARDWKTRGIVNASNTPFVPAHLGGICRRKAYAGIRVHKTKDKDQETKGCWPPLVDEDVFWNVQAVMDQPSRRTTRPGGARHALTGIIRCGVCGGPLSVQYRKPAGTAVYGCKNRGCVGIGKEPVDEQVIGAIVAYLSRPEIFEELARPDEQADDRRADLARARAELAAIKAAPAPRTLTAQLDREHAIDQLAEDIERMEQAEREAMVPPVLAAVLTPGQTVADWWDAASVAAKRAVAALVLSPAMLGRCSVVRGRGVPAADRIEFRR